MIAVSNMNQSGKQTLWIKVAGKERSHDLGDEISVAAANLQNPDLEGLLADERPIRELLAISDEETFLTRYLEVSGARNQIDLNRCKLPSTSGGITKRTLALVRQLVWRLNKFAFEWLLFHLNVINEQQSISLAHEVRLRRKENAELQARIEALEKRVLKKEEHHS